MTTDQKAPMKPSEMIHAGRRRLETRGWIQGASGDYRQGYCAVGAVSRHNWQQRHWAAAVAYLCKGAGVGDRCQLVAWNDARERTMTDVLDAFEHAEKYALEDGK